MVIGIPPLTLRYAGSRISAAIYEQDVTDSINFLTNPPIFSAVQASGQSIADSSWTALNLDSSTYDPYSGHSNVTNSSRWTCPGLVPGRYLACGVAVTAQNSTGNRGVRLQVNSTAVPGSASFVAAAGSTNGTGVATPMIPVYLNGGDYIEVASWQNSGAPLNTAVFGDLTTSLSLVFIHA